MQIEFDSELERLSATKVDLTRCAQAIVKGIEVVNPLDYLVTAAINRSFSLIDGYVLLSRSDNFLCAAHLIRLHLDTFLRLGAVYLVDDAQEFASQVLSGKKVSQIKDRTNKPMRDNYLKDALTKEFEWIGPVYDSTSGFIHLSRRHFISSMEIIDFAEGTIRSHFSDYGEIIPIQAKIECTSAMIDITGRICDFAHEWVEARANPVIKA